uniref:Uncharacterized protein n=1 Tax=Rhizophora mucronata TaxID=61149 RepID=A0A2P2PA08_RHIMU
MTKYICQIVLKWESNQKQQRTLKNCLMATNLD